MSTAAHSQLDYSGSKFGVPNPVALTKSWQVSKGLRKSSLTPLAVGAITTLAGQDSTSAASCTRGLPVYAGYYNGTFANLNSFRADFPAAIILSITPNGIKGARCIDCEPGDATVAGAANFVAANLPDTSAGGRNDGGKPMVYCSAGDSQAVVNAVAAKGIARDQWILWSAHWIGQHICSPGGCGYPQADGTQYASNNSFDSDLFYSYCFGAVVSTWPLQNGSSGSLVATLQTNINKWVTDLAGAFGLSVMLKADGSYGPLTAAAVTVAQLYFRDAGPSGTCSQQLYTDLAATPVSPWPLVSGDTGPLVTTLQKNLNRWHTALRTMSAPLVADGNFGPLTMDAVKVAQVYFKVSGLSGSCNQVLFADLAVAPPNSPPPPPPPPLPFGYAPVTGLKLLGAGPHSVKFEFTAGAQVHAGLAKFQVVISKSDKLTTNIAGYPRYTDFAATGVYALQFGGVEPGTGYTLGVRGMAQDGSHSSSWAILHFQTAA